MTNARLSQIQAHLDDLDPSRVDGHVVLITGGAQGYSLLF
jgi:hypothetical protein